MIWTVVNNHPHTTGVVPLPNEVWSYSTKIRCPNSEPFRLSFAHCGRSAPNSLRFGVAKHELLRTPTNSHRVISNKYVRSTVKRIGRGHMTRSHHYTRFFAACFQIRPKRPKKESTSLKPTHTLFGVVVCFSDAVVTRPIAHAWAFVDDYDHRHQRSVSAAIAVRTTQSSHPVVGCQFGICTAAAVGGRVNRQFDGASGYDMI